MPESSPQSHTPEQPDTNSVSQERKDRKRTRAGLSQRFVDTLGWVITGIWGASMLLHAANIGYEPPASIHLLMMVVAGAAFGTNFIKPKDGEANVK